MRVLLDTHALVWAAGDPDRLSSRARATIADPATIAFVSLTSAWELAILQGLGRVRLEVPLGTLFTQGLAALRFHLLAIRLPHVAGVAELPRHHRDPFDRLLVATALAEKLAVVSADRVFKRYGVTVVW
ncbi:MAG TPA: type II toxin-antitoxin system VapC family toxin [Gemmatimonadaceae bacterium]